MIDRSVAQVIDAMLNQARAEAWAQGFRSGQSHGGEIARYDPQWDEYEPVCPENPYAPRSSTPMG